MKTIYKYPLGVTDSLDILLPPDAEILCIKPQGTDLFLWAKVNDDGIDMEFRTIRMFGTGHPIPENLSLKYIDTFMLREDRLVFHAFEELSLENKTLINQYRK